MISVSVFGAAGRMGRSIIRDIAESFPDVRLVGAVEREGHADLGRDAGELAGTSKAGVALSSDRAPAVGAADVVLDFTFHTEVPATAALCAERGKALLVGTTALTPEERAAVEAASAKIPAMIASNLSVGVNLLFDLVRRAAEKLGPGFDIEICEMHHRHKKDAPSGTAVSLAKAAAEGRGLEFREHACYGRSGVTGERDPDTIAVHAMRGGDVVGDHRVLFASDGEILELSHRATSRTCLSSGAVRTGRWLASQKPGMHTVAEMLGL